MKGESLWHIMVIIINFSLARTHWHHHLLVLNRILLLRERASSSSHDLSNGRRQYDFARIMLLRQSLTVIAALSTSKQPLIDVLISVFVERRASNN
jgi:hypothetical protein